MREMSPPGSLSLWERVGVRAIALWVQAANQIKTGFNHLKYCANSY